MENKGESDHNLEILVNLDSRESRDSSSEKTPFVMTPFAGPEVGPLLDRSSCKRLSDINPHHATDGIIA